MSESSSRARVYKVVPVEGLVGQEAPAVRKEEAGKLYLHNQEVGAELFLKNFMPIAQSWVGRLVYSRSKLWGMESHNLPTDAVAHAYMKLSQYDGRSDLRTWVTTVVKNYIIGKGRESSLPTRSAVSLNDPDHGLDRILEQNGEPLSPRHGPEAQGKFDPESLARAVQKFCSRHGETQADNIGKTHDSSEYFGRVILDSVSYFEKNKWMPKEGHNGPQFGLRLLILRQYYGYKIKELAKLSECPEGTIKSLIVRTKEELKRIYCLSQAANRTNGRKQVSRDSL